MENPSRLEANVEVLSNEMASLCKLRDELTQEHKSQMKGWLAKVESKVEEFDVLKNEFNELNKGSLGVRHRLNRTVIEILKSVKVLKEVGNAVSESIDDLTGERANRFTHANLTKFTSNFSTKLDIGRNENLYKGQFPDGLQIVVKVLTDKDGVEETFMAEMNTMFKTSHRNLVKLYGFCFEKNMKAFVFEYMKNGSLDKILYENQHDIEWEKLYRIAVEIAQGLSYLHDGCDYQIIHCNVMPSNILLDSSFSPKITNFGATKLLSREFTHLKLSRAISDPSYAAPEMSMPSSDITYKCDVYNFGMMMIEVLGRRKNVQGEILFPRQVWNMFEKGQVEEIMKECGIEEKNMEKTKILCMIAFWCIQYTPENRPSMSTVVKMFEKEIQILMPPNPFVPSSGTLVKSFQEAVY